MIPVVGTAATGGKWVKKGVGAASNLAKNVDNVVSGAIKKSDDAASLVRRKATPGDIDTASQTAARREAFRQSGVPTSRANGYTVEPRYGKPNSMGPKGEPYEIIRTTDASGRPVIIEHHKWGHQYPNGTFQGPHYHDAPHTIHITYPES